MKIKFDITKPGQNDFVQIEKYIDSIEDGAVICSSKDQVNKITPILTNAGIKFTIEEMDADVMEQINAGK